MTNTYKKNWAAPTLLNLAVTETLGGPGINVAESEGGMPGHVSMRVPDMRS